MAPERPGSPPGGDAGTPAAGGVGGRRVCVLGTGRPAVAFTLALAARLAREADGLCVVIGATAAGDAAPTSAAPLLLGLRAPAGRRLARALAASKLDATARGRLIHVDVARSADGSGLAVALECIAACAAGVPTVVMVRGARTREHDPVLASSDTVVVVVAAEAPRALTVVARGELSHLAPATRVRSVPLPARLGPLARRAAVARALAADA